MVKKSKINTDIEVIKLHRDEIIDNHKEEHLKKFEHIYSCGVLNYEKHYNLVLNIESFSIKAGISPDYIFKRKVIDFFPKQAIIKIADFKQWDIDYKSGLILSSGLKNPIDACSSLVGGFIRVKKTARLITLQTLMAYIKDRESLNQEVLIIPNFYTNGATLLPYLIDGINAFLIERKVKGMKTIVYVHDMKGMRNTYGDSLTDFLNFNYY